VDDFVHVRINNYEMLNSLLEKMEVKSWLPIQISQN
jgi:hypothetical protein